MHPKHTKPSYLPLRHTISAALLLLAPSASACMPALTIVIPILGSAGFGAVATGVLWTLPVVVALKAALFGRLAGYGALRAAGDMVLGNFVSSLPGVFITAGVLVANGFFPFVGTFVACGFAAWIVGRKAARVFTAEAGELRGIFAEPKRLEIALFLALFLATVAAMFSHGMSFNSVDRFPPLYWLLKYTATFLGLLASILITVVFEAAVIFRRARKRGAAPDQRLLNAIIKANLWTFLIASVIGAALRLPDRLRDPSFLDYALFQ